jgi:hypothetical protein
LCAGGRKWQECVSRMSGIIHTANRDGRYYGALWQQSVVPRGSPIYHQLDVYRVSDEMFAVCLYLSCVLFNVCRKSYVYRVYLEIIAVRSLFAVCQFEAYRVHSVCARKHKVKYLSTRVLG